MEPNEELRTNVKAWIARVISSVQGANASLKSFRGTLKEKYGIPERVRLSFPLHYVFVEKGVGKGRGINSGKTTPKPAINPAISAHIEELADIAADGCASIASQRLFIK